MQIWFCADVRLHLLWIDLLVWVHQGLNPKEMKYFSLVKCLIYWIGQKIGITAQLFNM